MSGPACDTTGMSDTLTIRQLQQIDLARLTNYLREHGWRDTGSSFSALANWWEPATVTGGPDALVPLFDDVFDYEVRIDEVLTAITQVEGRTKRAVYADLTGTVDPDQARAILAALDRIERAAEAAMQQRAQRGDARPLEGAHYHALRAERERLAAMLDGQHP